jgi:peptidoglycan/xylan/chitin deacetylase (PgdA/CDA1 family)
MLWSVDPSDYTRPGAGVIVDRVLAAVRPGAIVELHLLPETAAALPAMIAGLRARGYRLVTLPGLFRAAEEH